jgi:hypothetical protein
MTSTIITARNRIIKITRPLADEQKKYLEGLKQKARKRGKRQDIIWYMLLSSMATMGNVRGYLGLICDRENYDKISYPVLQQRSPQNKLRVLEATLRVAKVRHPAQKAKWLASNFQRIAEMGGLAAAKRSLLKSKGQQGKLIFLKTFDGINDKYARNMMMDIYHPEFHDCIAVDQRIKTISTALNISFADYKSEEDFYREAAHKVGLQAWEFDRLLFKFAAEVLCLIKLEENRQKKGLTNSSSQQQLNG